MYSETTIIIVVLLTIASMGTALPQQLFFDRQQQQQPQPPSTAATPQISSTTTAAPQTTQSPAFIACLANCPTTSEYNPVCGTNRVNYNNRQKLDCANFCGPRIHQDWVPVATQRLGTCSPL